MSEPQDTQSGGDAPIEASIIILTYHSDRFIGPCLESLKGLAGPSREIIVVDNASHDRTPEIVRGLALPVQLIVKEENLGFGGGNNVGWRAARGKYLIFLNPDTTVLPGWLEGMLAPFADPLVAVVGCKIYYPGGRTLQHAGAVLHSNAFTDHIGHNEEDCGQYDSLRDVDYVMGASMAIRRPIMERLGGFDEDYFPAYFEESDLCYRLRKEGMRVVYTPHAAIHHHEAVSLEKFSDAFYRTYYSSRIKFLIKNYGLTDWLFRFLAAEIRWFLKPESKGLRHFVVKSYWEGLRFIGKKLKKFAG